MALNLDDDDDDLMIREELKKILPIDTREGLANAEKQVRRNRERFVVLSRQSMAKAASIYADFAKCIEQSQTEAEVAEIREAAEQLQRHSTSLCTLGGLFGRNRLNSDVHFDRVVHEIEAQFNNDDNTWTDCRVTLLERSIFIDNVQVPLDCVHAGTQPDTFVIEQPDEEQLTIRVNLDEARALLLDMIQSMVTKKQQRLLSADNLDNSKLTVWLDDLHEAMAMGNFETALEAVDRIRYELASKGDSNACSVHSKRLDKYVSVLEEQLLRSLKRQSMDPNMVAKLVHLLNGLGRGVEARDCLLSAYSDRITSLKLQCCAGGGHASVPMELQCTIIINALANAVSVVRKAFSDPAMSSGLLVWLQAHILNLSKDIHRHRNCVDLLQSAKTALTPLKDLGFDLEFLLTF